MPYTEHHLSNLYLCCNQEHIKIMNDKECVTHVQCTWMGTMRFRNLGTDDLHIRKPDVNHDVSQLSGQNISNTYSTCYMYVPLICCHVEESWCCWLATANEAGCSRHNISTAPIYPRVVVTEQHASTCTVVPLMLV